MRLRAATRTQMPPPRSAPSKSGVAAPPHSIAQWPKFSVSSGQTLVAASRRTRDDGARGWCSYRPAVDGAPGSVQPVLEFQSRNFREIGGVACQQRGIVREGDAGDFQIHGSDANAIAPQADESVGSIRIPRQDQPRGEEFDAVVQLSIGRDLLVRIREPVQLRQPAAQGFLGAHNRRRRLFAAESDPVAQARTRLGPCAEFPHMVRVEDEHGASGLALLFAVFAAQAVGLPRHVIVRQRSECAPPIFPHGMEPQHRGPQIGQFLFQSDHALVEIFCLPGGL